MALFDALIGEINGRFPIENKAQELLSGLLVKIADEARGGLRGFLELFRRVGLGDVADTWVNEGANAPLSHQQTEDALGENTISETARRDGLSQIATVAALSFMIPAVVDVLTPDGRIPNNVALRAVIGSYLGTGAPNASAASPAANRIAAASAKDAGNGLLRLVLPLLLFLLLAYLAYLFLLQPNQDVPRVAINANGNANANQGGGAATIENSNVAATTNAATVEANRNGAP